MLPGNSYQPKPMQFAEIDYFTNAFHLLLLTKKTIVMPYTASVNPAIVQEWIAGKLETSTVRQLLLEKGWNEETIAAHLAEFKKLKYGKRQLRTYHDKPGT
jgi:hypothetical protein